MTEIVKTLENIKALSKINNIAVKSIEKELGYSSGYLSRQIKEGGSNISFASVLKACSIFNVTLQELMTNDYSTTAEQMKLEEEYQKQLNKLNSIREELDKLVRCGE